MASVSAPPLKKRKLNTETLSPISRVIHSSDYFEVLELSRPHFDELNRIIWTVQKNEIKKQYFKISRQVHPDRHIETELEKKRAASSFDVVQRAFETLNDNIKREEYVNEYGEKLKYKHSKTKFEIMSETENENQTENNNEKRNRNKILLLSLDEQTKELEKGQIKRLRKKQLLEQEASEYEKKVFEEFQQRRKLSEMKRIRAKQTKKVFKTQIFNNKSNTNKNDSDSNDNDSDINNSDDSSDDSDVEYNKTLSQLRNKQRKQTRKRRFR